MTAENPAAEAIRGAEELAAPSGWDREASGGAGARGATQARMLVELAHEVELFHAPDGTSYADVRVNGYRATLPIRGRSFRQWLLRACYENTGSVPGSEALQSALGIIEAKAQFDGIERAVHVRVAGHGGRIYLDLGDKTWRAIEIDSTGWRLLQNPPVRFRRSAGMRPLPLPARRGSIEALRAFLNVRSDNDFALAVSWLAACLRDRGPYPLIVLSGEQGSAKSTFSAILRALIDPNTAPLRALPREDRDLFIAASNAHVLVFDNVSGLPGFVSDTLCRLAMGAGFAVRQLYTDQEETLFTAARPVILNGIDDIVNRPDLADRALFLSLTPIPEDRRRPEAELWAAFEAEKPRLLGALLDAVVVGLRRLPGIQLERLPRMADFALWATACETAHWPEGRFMAAYDGNREEAVENVIDSDAVAVAVRELIADKVEWEGTATELLAVLTAIAGERVVKSKSWPGDARALSSRLKRAATFLRKVGIEVTYAKKGRNRTRVVQLASAASAPSAVPDKISDETVATDTTRTLTADAGKTADGSSVRPERRDDDDPADVADAADAEIAYWREERAAIAQYDGRLRREDAERLAAREFVPELCGWAGKSAEQRQVAAGEISQLLSAQSNAAGRA